MSINESRDKFFRTVAVTKFNRIAGNGVMLASRVYDGARSSGPMINSVRVWTQQEVNRLGRLDWSQFMRQRGWVGGFGKRAMDIALALTAIVLLSPIILIVALAIRLSEGGPVMFSQKRLGFNGREFDCYKFRTMVTNAEERLAQLLENDPEAALEWRKNQKLVNDPRITTLGHILRKSSLDELPQLINILRGDMSCVGPRPILVKEIERYGRAARFYMRTRPGLTGLWQVSGRSSTSYHQRVVLDTFYVRRWSIWLDMWIIVKTIPALLSFEQTS